MLINWCNESSTKDLKYVAFQAAPLVRDRMYVVSPVPSFNVENLKSFSPVIFSVFFSILHLFKEKQCFPTSRHPSRLWVYKLAFMPLDAECMFLKMFLLRNFVRKNILERLYDVRLRDQLDEQSKISCEIKWSIPVILLPSVVWLCCSSLVCNFPTRSDCVTSTTGDILRDDPLFFAGVWYA